MAGGDRLPRATDDLDALVAGLGGTAARVWERLFPEASVEARDPVGWLQSRLEAQVWSKQREIAEAVIDHRHVAVQSAHATGKSWLAAALVAWWISTRPVGDAFAVTSAPTTAQVSAILWRELGRAHRRGGLAGRITGGGVPAWSIGEELVAYGRKPQDLVDPEQAAAAFQGIHARHVLVVLDEAAGIPPWLWDAAESLATSERARVLAIGNPTDPTSRFAEVCAPGSGWRVVKVSAFDTPAFTGERVPSALLDVLVSRAWVEERAARWGEASPMFVSRVLGEFPEMCDDGLIAPGWIREAQERDLGGEVDGDWGSFGVDVARSGGDETVIYRRRAGVVRLVHSARGQDTMATAGQVGWRVREVPGGEAFAVVDDIGVGGGVVDRLRELGVNVRAFNAAERASRPDRYRNRRAEVFYELREAFRDGRVDLDPEDEDLAAQLGSIRWGIDSSQRIYIESKDDMRRRGLPSPDRADAVAMAFVGSGVLGRGVRGESRLEAYLRRRAERSRPDGLMADLARELSESPSPLRQSY